tara:strand:+ start:14526 stop:15803 length:1278 start_codon:yes stop_codon:yes gene_type:complete
MEIFKSNKSYSLNKSTYINLRWIAIIGQFLTINIVKFYFDFDFDFILANIIVFVGILTNFYLIYKNTSTQVSDETALKFLILDILQLSFLLYLTGGTINPFSIFLIIPSVFASSSLSSKSNYFLITLTFTSIVVLTFFHKELPSPLNTYIFNKHYYYSFPIALCIALIFLNYFALIFGKESRLRKEALDKIQEVIAKEHELVSLGGQAAAAAHSLGTPLSTIKIISNELKENFKNDKDLKKDIDLLLSQVNRCHDILKKLSLNPDIEDSFIDRDLSLKDYINEIVKSFEEISKKEFIVNNNQDFNSFKIHKSIELVYGMRNFIGNANKFSSQKVFITLKSNSETSEIIIEDDGPGFPKDVLAKIGEPYISSVLNKKNNKSGLGLGIFIGKTLLEKNFAKINFRNSETRRGAEVNILWKNSDLKSV